MEATVGASGTPDYLRTILCPGLSLQDPQEWPTKNLELGGLKLLFKDGVDLSHALRPMVGSLVHDQDLVVRVSGWRAGLFLKA